MFRRACQKRQERPPGRVRSGTPSSEPGGDTGAPERLLEVGSILAGRAQEDRHAIKRHTLGRLFRHTARDLHAFACFAGPGGERKTRISIASAWRRLLK